MENIFFGMAIVMAFILPFYYFIASKKRAMEALIKNLKTQLEPFGIIPGEMEVLGEKVIGFNELSSHLFYYQNNKNQKNPMVVTLSDFMGCKAVTSFTRSGNPGSESSIIQKVELVFEPKSKNGAACHVQLYDLIADMQIQGELQLAEKWQNKVTQILAPESLTR